MYFGAKCGDALLNTRPLEMEAGAPGVQSQPQLSSMPESSLGYMRPISKQLVHIYLYV